MSCLPRPGAPSLVETSRDLCYNGSTSNTSNEGGEGLRDYELVFIISPEVAEDKVSVTVERITQFITERGGNVAQIDHWGKRRFAYSIGHFNEGNYVLARLKLEPNTAKELEGSLRISEDILRHLLVRSESPKKKAVPVDTPSNGQGDGGSAENGGIEQDNDNR